MYARVATIGMTLVFLLVSVGSGLAWTPQDDKGGNCTSEGVTWSYSPIFFINITSNDFDTATKRNAVIEPLNRIGPVAGAWISPLYFLAPVDSVSNNGLSEIYMGDMDGGWSATTEIWVVPGTCTIQETDIKFNVDQDWAYNIPSTYYDPDLYADGGNRYVRIVALHELGHAIGLGHEDDAFSFMNYFYKADGGVFSNRTSSKMVEPLPDDREGLRAQYPDSGTERDLAVLNHWVDTTDVYPDQGAAYNKKLCKPAKGNGWTSSIFAEDYEYCATNHSTTVCPGDDIRTRFTVANYGTSSEWVWMEMWLSTNETWSYSGDYKSPTKRWYLVGDSSSARRGATFKVPTGIPPLNYYYVILKVHNSGSNPEESAQNNWMVLRGKVWVPICQ
jgi:matrixin